MLRTSGSTPPSTSTFTPRTWTRCGSSSTRRSPPTRDASWTSRRGLWRRRATNVSVRGLLGALCRHLLYYSWPQDLEKASLFTVLNFESMWEFRGILYYSCSQDLFRTVKKEGHQCERLWAFILLYNILLLVQPHCTELTLIGSKRGPATYSYAFFLLNSTAL